MTTVVKHMAFVPSVLLVYMAVIGQEQTKSGVVQMLQSLTSVNEAPQLVEHDISDLIEFGPTKLPLFPKDFIWQNQKEVRNSIASLGKISSVEDLDVLIEHIDDEHYSITIIKDRFRDPENYTVGMICNEAVYDRLTGVFLNKLPVDTRNRPVVIEFDDHDMRDLKKWRQQRRSKSLADLQIELGERILAAVPAVEFASDETKAEMSREVSEQIERIRKTGRPAIGRFWNEYKTYTPDQAMKIAHSLSENER